MAAEISLKTVTDDILLMIRNNNISESEDFSRSHIHAWINAYKSKIWNDELQKRKLAYNQGILDYDNIADNEFIHRIEVGPLMLEKVEEVGDDVPIFTKRTVDKLEDVLNNSEDSILAVHDRSGENIQYMNHIRRHYAYWRKHTFGEMTAYYKDDGHIYVLGLADEGLLKYIYVLYLKEMPCEIEDGEDPDSPDEDEVMIPGWMVPPIKDMIMKNELAFMLKRPSDDSNNATLASVKPHGPLDDEE